MTDHHPSPATLGQLRETDYRYRPVKQELRENLIDRLRSGQPIFPGVRGYEDTVEPQVVHALLARHDVLFLGLRGQAKTRMLRMLPGLLDEWAPVIADLDIPDDPLVPSTRLGQRRVAELGDDTPIRWLGREQRYHEKLATPDVTIADLLGEIDIVKHAEGRHLSDEETMHFGLVPRSNRGIFAINELPDLAPRIQVGLFNVLEERDVQIRGYPIRLNLDLALMFSANPEDYTNRGRIVTPLKDRIGSVVRTHYPLTLREGMQITRENAWTDRLDRTASNGQATAQTHKSPSPEVVVPDYLHRVLEEAIVAARTSSHINQASGVSVRTSIACLETIVSSAERRGILTGEDVVVARICDLQHVLASTRGKVELMMADDSDQAEDRLVAALIGEAVKKVFDQVADIETYEDLGMQFDQGLRLTIGDTAPADELVAGMQHVDGLAQSARQIAEALEVDPDDPAMLAGAGEFLLEALYVHNRLSKHGAAGGVAYGR